MTLENTEGYTQGELDVLNTEFITRFKKGDWDTDDKEEAEKWFDDEVARR